MKFISLVIIFVFLIYLPIMATEPQVREFEFQGDFEKGKSNGISITSTGTLQLAPQVIQVCDSNEPFIWDLAVNKQGKIFFCAGNEGNIYTVDKTGNPIVFCRLDETEIYTLAYDNQGVLYAGTSPAGKVYRISANGSPQIYYDPPDKYIWDLLFDRANNLFIATGDSGIIYKVNPAAKSTIFFDSEETHIRCLALDRDGNLLAGSYENGYIYRIKPNGEAFVIYDSDLKEIHQIDVDKNGTIYAAALGQPPTIMPPPKPQQKVPANNQDENVIIDENGEETVIIGEIQIEAPVPQKAREKVAESAVYKIMTNGFIRNLWDDYQEPVQTFILDESGHPIVGTGKTGKLVKLISADEKTTLTGLEESQITVFQKNDKNEILFATSNMGKIYKISNDYQKSGTYTSEIIDSYTISKWGSISWECDKTGEGQVSFYTRSGNTEEPNNTWSNWSSAYTNSDGSNITNPDARFVQWKLEVKTNNIRKTPKIKKVTVSYMQTNLPPEIASITIYPQGEYYQEAEIDIEAKNPFLKEDDDFDSGGNQHPANKRNHYLGRKTFRNNYRTLNWMVIDDNNDHIIYDLYYREQSEKFWKTLVKNWHSPAFAWDTERMADGLYYIKLQASDSLSNPQGVFLKTEKISEPFSIDNSGPKISQPEIKSIKKRLEIAFTVTDEYNTLKEVSYSIDGKDWKSVYPIDNIMDTKVEKFLITTSLNGDAGNHTLVIKALDSLKNTSFLRTHFED